MKILMILVSALMISGLASAGVTNVGGDTGVRNTNDRSEYRKGYRAGYNQNSGDDYTHGFLDGQRARRR